MSTATEIDVSNAVAWFDQLDDCCVGDLATVTEMNIVKEFTQFTNGIYSNISDVLALGKNQVSEFRCRLDDSLHSIVR